MNWPITESKRFIFAVLVLWLWFTPAVIAAWVWPPYKTYVPPTKARSTVTMTINLAAPDIVRIKCQGASGCMIAETDKTGKMVGIPVIWAPMPSSFNDLHSLTVLGHEVLHALGANHD